jgi:hypothetical protein
MMKNLPNRNYHRKYPDPFPVESLKRVDRPTTLIEDHEVSRVDEREGGFNRSGRGDFMSVKAALTGQAGVILAPSYKKNTAVL